MYTRIHYVLVLVSRGVRFKLSVIQVETFALLYYYDSLTLTFYLPQFRLYFKFYLPQTWIGGESDKGQMLRSFA